jgi:hypothetical protein
VGEHEVALALPARLRVEPIELAGDFVGERNRPGRPLALRSTELTADVALADANAAGTPVNVLPAERQKLA